MEESVRMTEDRDKWRELSMVLPTLGPRTSKEQNCMKAHVTHTHTHTHPFNGPLSRTTRVSRYQKGNTNLDFTEARDSE